MVVDPHALKAYKTNGEVVNEHHQLDVIVGREAGKTKTGRETKKFTEVLRERLQERKS